MFNSLAPRIMTNIFQIDPNNGPSLDDHGLSTHFFCEYIQEPEPQGSVTQQYQTIDRSRISGMGFRVYIYVVYIFFTWLTPQIRPLSRYFVPLTYSFV
ncbi:hypothetical protein P691DRAFT_267312 [Macrolepiota fuliginosa MF-IS2]|uniref:Uncharacterized protein n=1 Tax=Macrolepiota fuliginosa MF-IS2 TaxID=1400762 RepID=A0A9P5XIL7_9AGAR|nr:hypothetical protein P691DRAFT_267312 [Macrolepiota fuliginosa MF-IS2]